MKKVPGERCAHARRFSRAAEFGAMKKVTVGPDQCFADVECLPGSDRYTHEYIFLRWN